MELKGMRFRARIGCLESEQLYGGVFEVDFRAEYLLLGRAVASDSLSDAADYSAIFRLVEAELSQPALLLESVAARIAKAIRSAFPDAFGRIELTLRKMRPPVGGACAWASITVTDLP